MFEIVFIVRLRLSSLCVWGCVHCAFEVVFITCLRLCSLRVWG